MRKLFTGILLVSATSAVFAAGILAPAAQLDISKYKDYFKKKSDYKVNLKSLSDYKITCSSDIAGIVWGDTENIKIFDEKNNRGEIIDMKSTVIKTKYRTNSYIRLYKVSEEIVNIVVNVSPMNSVDYSAVLGLCKLEPYGG